MSQNLQQTISDLQDFDFGVFHLPPEFVAEVKTPASFLVKVDISDWDLTDEQLENLSKKNPQWKMEINAEGELEIMPSTGFITGVRNRKLSQIFGIWSDENGTGKVADSSTMFRLPNGARRSPDVSWVLNERLKKFSEKQLEGMIPLAPDFVIELRSPNDSLKDLRGKMVEYIENGVRLGWLIDPSTQKIHVYRPNAETEILENPDSIGDAEVLPNFTLDLTEIWHVRIS